MLDYLEALAKTNVIEEAWSLHCAKMAEYGFDRLIYAYTLFGTATSVGPREDALILSNHPAAYFKQYIEDEHYLHAPLTQWALHNFGARSWSVIGDEYDQMGPQERAVVDLNRKSGVLAGYAISFRNSRSRARGIIALTAKPGLSQRDVNALWERHGREISVICNMAHLKFTTLPHTSARDQLSPKQKEVLEWVADGKSNLDVATILGRSLGTVEKHLRLIREKLGVETTAQAVLKASFQNQFFIVQTKGLTGSARAENALKG